jgi:hypothetical protein
LNLESPTVVLDTLAERLLRILGGASTAGTPAGSRPEGRAFEVTIGETWREFFELHRPWIELRRFRRSGERTASAFEVINPRLDIQLYLPLSAIPNGTSYPETTGLLPPAWLQRSFLVSELLEAHLGKGIPDFAPPTPNDSRQYWGRNYPGLYKGKTTKFDFTIALARSGTLIEKLLFEYKYAKSSKGITVDGNAHERLSFQTLEYLEIATRYTHCSLNVITSDAIVQYKNKYHPSFHQHAVRLSDAFRAFTMRIASCRSDYLSMFGMLSRFLLTGQELPSDYRNP